MAAKIFKDLSEGLQMPAVGLGTGTLREEAEFEKTLNTALELGYRHIDTAYMYQNEALLGGVLQKWFSSGKLKRSDVFITTKLPLPGTHQDRVELFLKKSLKNLQLEYVDLFLIHFPIGTKYFGDDSEDNYKEIDHFDHLKIWKKMEEQVHLGRTKTIGLSNFTKKQIERIIKSAKIKPASLQVELHVDFQQRDLVDYCHKNGIVVVAYSPLGAPARFEDRAFPAAINSDIVKNIAKKYSKSPGQLMLRYLLQRDIVVIPKSSNADRLKQNIDIFDFEINIEDMKSLDKLDGGEETRLNTFRAIPGAEDHPEYPF